MKFYTITFLLAAVILGECGHTFIGTNVMRLPVFHKNAKYPPHLFLKTIEYINFTLPPHDIYGRSHGRTIQGILAYDMTHSGASLNITHGGIGQTYATLRLKSDRAAEMQFDIYIYA